MATTDAAWASALIVSCSLRDEVAEGDPEAIRSVRDVDGVRAELPAPPSRRSQTISKRARHRVQRPLGYPLYGFVVTWIVLMPIMSAYMQSATNRLLDLREHEAATATGPPRPS